MPNRAGTNKRTVGADEGEAITNTVTSLIANGDGTHVWLSCSIDKLAWNVVVKGQEDTGKFYATLGANCAQD